MTADKSSTNSSSGNKSAFPRQALLVVGVLVVAGVAAFLFMGNNSITGLVTAPTPKEVITDTTPATTATESSLSAADQRPLLIKSRYVRDVYSIHRDRYHIYEKSAAKRNQTIEQTAQFFYDCCGLSSEEEIFSSLPTAPANFADIAYDVAVGNNYDIASLGPDVYKQPEFYFIGTESSVTNQFWAFNPWIDPALNYWGEYGGNAFPSYQEGVVKKSGSNQFNSIVFFTNSWNIQNFVGYNLVADSESQKYFDISIAEENTGQPYFILGPTFPRFDSTWATRVAISGKAKPGTPAGTYDIHISPIAPPSEIEAKWSGDHAAQYASYGAISPTGGYITLHVTVSE